MANLTESVIAWSPAYGWLRPEDVQYAVGSVLAMLVVAACVGAVRVVRRLRRVHRRHLRRRADRRLFVLPSDLLTLPPDEGHPSIGTSQTAGTRPVVPGRHGQHATAHPMFAKRPGVSSAQPSGRGGRA
jgi:hypothetical protein